MKTFRSLVCAVAALAILSPSLVLAADVPSGLKIPAHVTKDMGDGDVEVSYEITQDVHDSSGTVIIPKGATGRGRVIQYKSPNGWGGPGKTEVSLENVTLPDGKTMTVDAKATKYGADTRFASIFFLGLWGGLTKGGSGKIGDSTNLTFTTR